MTLVRVIILMGIICVVPSFSFGQITIECLNNEEITGPECYDCTAASDTALFTGFRIIHAGVDTTMIESPWRLKVRRSTNEWIFIDYRDQIKFSTVANLTDFANLDELIAYVKDCQSFTVDYMGDSTAVIHWGDTMHITYPEPSMGGGGDTTYYWVRQVNGVGNDTITVGEVENLVAGTNITISQGATNITFDVPNMRDTCRHTLVQVTDTTAALLDCLGDTMGIIAFAFPDGLQHLYALPDSSNRLILTDGDGIPMDTVEFFGIGLFNDLRLDSLRYADDTLTAFIRDTSGIVDSIKVEIVLGDTDTDIDSMKLIGNVLHLYEDEVELTVDLSQFLDNTDNQQVTNFNFNDGTRVLTLEIEDDGQAPHTVTIPDTDEQQVDTFSFNNTTRVLTIAVERDGQPPHTVTIPDSIGVGQPDTYLDSIRHITVGQIDSIWFYRDSTGYLVDSFLVVLHDSVGSGITTNDTYLSATWCSGDTLYAERSDTSGIIDTLIVAGVPCSRDTCELLVEQITFGSAFGYSLVTGLRYTYCGVVDSVCFVGSIKYIPYQHDHDSLYFLTETIVDCDSVTIGLLSVYIKPSNDIRVDTTWFIDDTLYQQIVDTSGIIDTIITEINVNDYDFILLDGDTMVTLVDTLLPKDSADLHKLIWHGGRVRLGLPAYEHSIYLDTTTGDYLNFVLHQDSVDTGLQIFGRRSALDIYHSTRPYQHFRNQFGEFWQRIFDPTAEGPLEPQRWEFGAVGKYEGDTTSRAIFTIRNDADPFSLNITPNFLQSDIYKSDRAIDTTNIHGIFAADSSGRFVLMNVDSVGDINIINPADADWYVWGGTALATDITQNIYTEGKAFVGNGVNSSMYQFQILHDTNSFAFRTATSENYSEWLMSLKNESAAEIQWYQSGQSNTSRRDWRITGSTATTSGVYASLKEGYDEILNPAFIIKSDGDIGFGQYKESRDDLEPSSAITNMIYMSDDAITSESFGVMKMASIDSLAAALQLTGIISGSDSLGRDGIAGQVVIETATKAGTSYSEFTASSTQVVTPAGLRVGLNRAGDGASNLDLVSVAGQPFSTRLFRASGTNGGFSFQNAGTGNLNFSVNGASVGFVVRGTDRSIAFPAYTSTASFPGTAVGLIGFDASGNLLTEALVTGADQLGTAFTDGALIMGDNTTTGKTDATNLFYDDPNNRLGVGTNSPQQALHVISPALGDGIIISASGTNGPGLRLYNDVSGAQAQNLLAMASNQGMIGSVAGDYVIRTAGGDMILATTGTIGGISSEAMRVTTAQRVGIGITNPTYKLEIGGVSDAQISVTASSSSEDAGINFRNSGSNAHSWRAYRTSVGNFSIGYSSAFTYSVTTFPLVVEAGAPTNQLRIDNSGIGIGGVSTPTNTIHVDGSARITGLAGTGTRMVTATSTGVLGTAAIPSGGDGDGIYTGNGNVGGGSAHVTATVGSSFNFNIRHQSVDKLIVGTSGTFLRSTSGGSVLVGDPTNEMAFYYNSGLSETRMRANNAGTGSYVYVANDGNMGMRATGSGDNILLQASGNVHLTSTTADIILSSGGSAGDATSISGFDYVNIAANSTTGVIEMVPASGSHGALYVVGSAGNVHISNETTTGGSAEYITINPSQIAINTSGNTRIAASTGLVELNGNVAINNGSLFGAGAAGVIGINNASGVPSSSPVNMVQLYAQDVSSSSELRVRDEGGTVTTLSPHNFSQIPAGKSEELAWSHYSEKDGKYINVDMLKLVRHVERMTGDKLVYSAEIGKEDETVLNYRGIIDQQAAQIEVLTEQVNKLYDLINKK